MPLCIRCHREMGETPFCPHCGARQERNPKGRRTRANGTGTAYKRGKWWSAQVTLGYYIGDDGKMKRITKTQGGFKSKTAALEHCEKLREQQQKKVAPLLREYWDSYSRTEMDRLSDSKRQAYTIAWGKMKAIANKPIDTISVAELRAVVAKECPTHYPARDAKSVLSHLYKLAGADGWVNKDLPSYIELPKLCEKETVPFTDEEQALLWQSYDAGNLDAGIPLIMIATGMMPGEMRKLTVSMIDLEGRKITGAGLKTETRKKLTIILPDDICPVIEDAMAGKDNLLYPMTEQGFYNKYYNALKTAGITRHLTPYSCRHTTATRHSIEEHTPPQVVARLMRWSSTKMLDRYVHPSDDDAKAAANSLGRHQKQGQK